MSFQFGGSAATKPNLSFNTTNPNPGGPLFGSLGQKPAETTTAPTTTSLFNSTFSKPTNPPSNPFNPTTTQNQLPTSQPTTTPGLSNPSPLPSGGPQIDLAHLRSTTKYDHLTPQLQHDILALDTAILNEIRKCTDVADIIPAVTTAGKQLAPAIDYINTKLDELETGLGNDAEAVVDLRDGNVSKDEGEAKCVFRTVDRLKMPRQYQVGGAGEVSMVPGTGFNGGLSGWWNQPQTFRGSSMRGTGAGPNMQLVDEDLDDDKNRGPKNLVELFGSRADEMATMSTQHRHLLEEIEMFVGGLEEKVYMKERDLNERLDNGLSTNGESGLAQEREHQMQLLRYVFGEVQKNLYEVAEKVGHTRDAVVDLSFGRG